ncbi:MAG: DUF3486 family protein [Verrucomicrobiota bacterium]|nr:DUF3486 family protein [Verrucomicrobiota bacterium]
MPAVSSISQLPEATRKALDHELLKRSFSGYADLETWLGDQGFRISKSAIHRYGQDFASKIEAIRKSTDLALALREQLGDDSGAMNDASIRLGQHLLFEIMQRIDPDEVDCVDVPKLMRALADLSRASVTQKKWQTEYEAEIRARSTEAAEAVANVAKTAGVTADGIAFMRRQILGIPQAKSSPSSPSGP